MRAESGDCIHLRFQSDMQWYNVVIDSGPCGNDYNFRTMIQSIAQKHEHVDLLCFSHVDDDHVNAARDYFSTPAKYAGLDLPKLIKCIWMNIPKAEVNAPEKKPNDNHQTSVGSATLLLDSIKALGISHEIAVLKGHEPLQLGQVKIEVVGPTQERLNEYEKWWEEKKKEDSNIATAPRPDDSETNGSSIILLVTAGDKKMLFCGDAFACDLEEIADEVLAPKQTEGESAEKTEEETADEEKTGFFLVKLPHHGSGRNITESMLEKMRCHQFVISTKATKYRPSAYALNLLREYGIKHKSKITLYGNYDWVTTRIKENDEGIQRVLLKDKAVPMASQEVTIRAGRYT